MSTINASDLSRLVATVVAAFALSALCLGGAIAPAGAAAPSHAQLA